MELKFNDAKSARPGHLERCLCYDKFLKGYRCYVYDDISKYWCTQATTEHDPKGDNHIVDYADYRVTEWASLQQEQQEQPTQGYDEAYLNEKIAKATKSWKGVDVDKFMDEVRGREPDKSLEEAAEDQARSFGYQEEDYEYKELVETFIAGAKWQEKRDEETIKTAEDHAFLAGADWQKEQMMKGAVEVAVEDWNPEPHPEITISLNPEEFTVGDKVKVIMIKED